MTELEIFWQQLDDCRSWGDDEAGRMALRRFARARSKQVKPRPKMQTFNFSGPTYNRRELGEFFLTNWSRLFGTMRKSKALEVPSDQLRKRLMIARLLDLVEMGRSEYAEE